MQPRRYPRVSLTFSSLIRNIASNGLVSPWVAGISGGPKGTYSIALSGGYPDDVYVSIVTAIIWRLFTSSLVQ